MIIEKILTNPGLESSNYKSWFWLSSLILFIQKHYVYLYVCKIAKLQLKRKGKSSSVSALVVGSGEVEGVGGKVRGERFSADQEHSVSIVFASGNAVPLVKDTHHL